MSKFKRIIQFILALLNFLFHFKTNDDEEAPLPVETYPRATAPPGAARNEPLFEDIP